MKGQEERKGEGGREGRQNRLLWSDCGRTFEIIVFVRTCMGLFSCRLGENGQWRVLFFLEFFIYSCFMIFIILQFVYLIFFFYMKVIMLLLVKVVLMLLPLPL